MQGSEEDKRLTLREVLDGVKTAQSEMNKWPEWKRTLPSASLGERRNKTMTKEEALKEIEAANKEGRPARLMGANLEGANLKEANLKEANLKEANLEGANLEGADLRWANLEKAHLWEADIRGANLEGANLMRCILCGVTWDGSYLGTSIGGPGVTLWGLTDEEDKMIREHRKAQECSTKKK